MPLLQVEGLSKHFYIDHLQREIAVFDSLNFTLEAGQFMLIGGANGAGKSSLLRCLYRTYLPSAGSAVFQSKHGLINLARAADVDIAVLRRAAGFTGGMLPVARIDHPQDAFDVPPRCLPAVP